MKMKDLTNQKFGMLTAIKVYEHGHYKQENKWLCKCDCGNEKIVSTGLLTHLCVTDCGCQNKKRLQKRKNNVNQK